VEKIRLNSGYITGLEVEGATVYRGIPYAAPPTGKLRWQAPQPVTSWQGVRECVNYSVQAAQPPDPGAPQGTEKLPCSEDCLYLNVTVPAEKPGKKLPVMVWFHGGGLRFGNGNSSLYNSVPLTKHGVILVTVNNRLGIFGLFAHKLLAKESPTGTSGNYMFLDMIASLKWVKKNIAAFGGDPDKVTIFGESGGGIKVIGLVASPLAKGLFHRAICESGGSNPANVPVKEIEGYGEQLFEILGVNKAKDPLAAARALSWEKVAEAEHILNEKLKLREFPIGTWSLSVEGNVFPDTVHNMFKAGKQNPVPYMLICNMGELTGPGFIVFPKMIPGYLKSFAGAKAAGVKAYAGIFDQVPPNWRKEGGVSSHGMEMHYVFGAVDDMAIWKTANYKAAGCKAPLPVITDAERKVSEYMMQMWTQFARTGNPSVKGLIEWPDWEPATDKYLYIVEPLQVKAGYSKVQKQE
jgi:para-nitrobenzyl esterase